MSWYVVSALLLILAWVFDLALLAWAVYVLLAVLISGRLLTRWWAEGLAAERQCNRLTVNVGDKVAVVVTLKNTSKIPVPWVLFEDLLPRHAMIFEPPSLRLHGQRLGLAVLVGGSQKIMTYQMECNRRGYYQLGPLVLETGDLFGLHRRWRVASKPNFLLVYPEVVPLEGYEVASRRPIGEIRMAYRLYEDPTRISGVRQYQAGDSLNRIHWRATARSQELQSKVYEPSTVAGATIFLDFHQQSHDPRHEPMRSELAITAAASVANAMYEMGQQIGLVTNGRDAADRVRQEGWSFEYGNRKAARNAAAMVRESDRLRPVVVETDHGPDQILSVLQTLARLELTDGLKLAELAAESASRMPRDATVLAIMPRVNTEDAIVLGNLKRRGFQVAAIINMYDYTGFAAASGPLIAAGIPTYHLRDREHVGVVCRNIVLGR